MAVGDGQNRCAECGTELSAGARFCRNCGRSVSEAVAAPPASGIAPSDPLGAAAPSPGTEQTTSIPVVPPRSNFRSRPHRRACRQRKVASPLRTRSGPQRRVLVLSRRRPFRWCLRASNFRSRPHRRACRQRKVASPLRTRSGPQRRVLVLSRRRSFRWCLRASNFRSRPHRRECRQRKMASGIPI